PELLAGRRTHPVPRRGSTPQPGVSAAPPRAGRPPRSQRSATPGGPFEGPMHTPAAHDHDHPHPALPDADGPLTYHQRLEVAVRELLLAKGVVSGDDIRRTLEIMDSQSPALGARVVARAWVDPAYRARLLADGTCAVEELGISMGTTKLVVVENTPQVHNLIVCTLCSCYPRPVLGLPPDWYKSKAYRSRAVREPRAVLAE